MVITENQSLKHTNTFGIDIFAKRYVEVRSVEELKEIIKIAKQDNSEILVIGSGSNILFTKNYNGLIVKNDIQGIEVLEEKDNDVFVKAGAGVLWDDLVEFCVDNNYWGVENLSLIPGTVGAAPIQNIGAYGVELSDSFYSLNGVFLDSLNTKTFYKNEIQFGYRNSIFKGELKGRFIITEVILKLSKIPKPVLTYRELKSVDSSAISLSGIRNKIIEIRKSKLPDPGKLGNAGSFFKNPVVDGKLFLPLKRKYKSIVYFEVGKNKYKISAGWLIENCGYKGKKVGNVGCYEKQALIIVNYGKATGDEVYKFSKNIQKEVKQKFGILLIPEVNII